MKSLKLITLSLLLWSHCQGVTTRRNKYVPEETQNQKEDPISLIKNSLEKKARLLKKTKETQERILEINNLKEQKKLVENLAKILTKNSKKLSRDALWEIFAQISQKLQMLGEYDINKAPHLAKSLKTFLEALGKLSDIKPSEVHSLLEAQNELMRIISQSKEEAYAKEMQLLEKISTSPQEEAEKIVNDLPNRLAALEKAYGPVDQEFLNSVDKLISLDAPSAKDSSKFSPLSTNISHDPIMSSDDSKNTFIDSFLSQRFPDTGMLTSLKVFDQGNTPFREIFEDLSRKRIFDDETKISMGKEISEDQKANKSLFQIDSPKLLWESVDPQEISEPENPRISSEEKVQQDQLIASLGTPVFRSEKASERDFTDFDSKEKESDKFISYSVDSLPVAETQTTYEFENPILWDEEPLIKKDSIKEKEYDPEDISSNNSLGTEEVFIKENQKDSGKIYDPLSPPFDSQEEILEIRKEADSEDERALLSQQKDLENQTILLSQEKELLEKIKKYTYAPYPYASLEEALQGLIVYQQPGRLKKDFSKTVKDLFQFIRNKIGEPPLESDFLSINPVRTEAIYLLKKLHGPEDEGVPFKRSRRIAKKAMELKEQQDQQAQINAALSEQEKTALDTLSQYTDKPYASVEEALTHLSSYKHPGRFSKDLSKIVEDVFRLALSKVDKEIVLTPQSTVSSVPMRKEAKRIREILENSQKESE